MGAVRGRRGFPECSTTGPTWTGRSSPRKHVPFRAAAVSQSVSDETAQWRSANSRAVQRKGRAGDVVDCWVTDHFNGRYNKSDVLVQLLIAEKAQSDASEKKQLPSLCTDIGE